jgi:hypothetical protein
MSFLILAISNITDRGYKMANKEKNSERFI